MPVDPFVPCAMEDVEQTIPACFERQAARYPERLAVKTLHHELTYTELNLLANRLAFAILKIRGIRPETIGVLLDHDVSLVIALLGILKAGKIYVPLDPAFLHHRLTQIKEDAQADLIITANKHMALARHLGFRSNQILNLDETPQDGPESNPDLNLSPD